MRSKSLVTLANTSRCQHLGFRRKASPLPRIRLHLLGRCCSTIMCFSLNFLSVVSSSVGGALFCLAIVLLKVFSSALPMNQQLFSFFFFKPRKDVPNKYTCLCKCDGFQVFKFHVLLVAYSTSLYLFIPPLCIIFPCVFYL